MHTQATSTARTEHLPPKKSRWNRVFCWLRRRKQYLLLEVLNLLEPRRPSHQ